MSSPWRVSRPLVVIAVLIVLGGCSWLFGPRGASQPPASAAEYAPGRILVRFAGDMEAVAIAGAEVVSTYDAVAPGVALVSLPDGLTVEEGIKAFESQPGVVYAEPDYAVRLADTIPNDYFSFDLWGLRNIKAPLAWDVLHEAPSVIVAVLDTGTDYTHPDLAANIWTNSGEIPGNGLDDDGNGYADDVHGFDFYSGDPDPMDESGHGTHTAGTACAVGNNGSGIVGVAWRCQIMPLRFMGAQGGFSSGAMEALNYAVAKGAKVSNNSWGGDGYSASLYTAIQNAGVAGHLFVAAAGNDAGDNDAVRFYPSSYDLDNILAVAAIDRTDHLASFSNYGARTVDLAAPGVSIFSTLPGSSYGGLSGTSMATPHVAGAAALLYALHPDWTVLHVKTQLVASARPLDDLQGRTVAGGTLDLAGALGPAFPEPTPTPVPPVHVGALSGTASVTTRNRWQAEVTILVHDQGETPRVGVLVTGRWSYGSIVSCQTGAFGSCIVASSELKAKTVRFDVTGLTLAGASYDPSANHVSSVTISKP